MRRFNNTPNERNRQVLTIHGPAKLKSALTLSEVQAMPLVAVTVKDQDGKLATDEGVAVEELLRRAGVPQNEALRGDTRNLSMLVTAADGYRVAFAFPELDSMFRTDRRVVLVYRRDGAPLDRKAGPLRLVLPDEKPCARWVRQVRDLTLVRVGVVSP